MCYMMHLMTATIDIISGNRPTAGQNYEKQLRELFINNMHRVLYICIGLFDRVQNSHEDEAARGLSHLFEALSL